MKHESTSFLMQSDLETILALVFEIFGQFLLLIFILCTVRLEACLVHATSTIHTKETQFFAVL